MEERKSIPFTSAMTPRERAAALLWLALHVYALPKLLTGLFRAGALDEVGVHIVCYGVGAAALLFLLLRFWRQEFDALCDYGPGALLEVVKAYGVLLLCNLAVNLGLLLAGRMDNPNNAAIFSMAKQDLGGMAAVAVFLAPLVEEPMFRGGVFGLLRRRSRAAAYAVSMLLFALYHVWSYALADPRCWLYLLQYLPAGFLLARCYEKTNTLWAAVFLHMTVNGVSMLAISAMGQYL